MKRQLALFLIIPLLFFSCQKAPPQLSDYIGVYKVIKIVDGNDSIKATMLTHIELTESLYISRVDRDNNNKFSQDEISMSTMLFSIGEDQIPQINISGNESTIKLLPDSYYDLLFERVDPGGDITTLYLKKVR